MIIGINGKIGSGKDTVGRIIQYLTDDLNKNNPKGFTEWVDGGFHASDWKIKKFAGKMKQIASLLTGIPVEKFEDQEFKKTNLNSKWDYNDYIGGEFIDLLSMSVREFLQKLGTDAIRNGLHQNAWVNALFADYKESRRKIDDEEYIKEYPNWIITDMRFPNEFDAVKSRNGITIKVTRPNLKDGYNFFSDQHQSEKALDKAIFDYEIINDGTMEELVKKVREILVNEKLI